MQTVFTDSFVDPTDETHTIDLTPFDNVASAEFRLYGFDADSAGGAFDIERFNAAPAPSRGIVVRGTPITVPEPGLGLMIVAAASIVMIRRRQRKRMELVPAGFETPKVDR